MRKTLTRLIVCAALALASITAIAPPALAGPLEPYAENKLIDAMFRGQALSAPSSWHIGVSTATCSSAAAEPAAAEYARVAVAASLAAWAGTQGAGSTTASSGTSATTSNNALIAFPESVVSGGWGNIQSVGFFDAASGGNRWICIDLAQAFNSDRAGITVKFNAGQLAFIIDQ